MNISLRWLAELVELPQLKTEAQLSAFAQQVTEHCFEVEKVHAQGVQGTQHRGSVKFSNVFTALVRSVEKHPNADRLRVVSLQLGDKVIEPVVCGAWNFDVGDVVALALPGAVIPHNVHSEAHETFTLGTAKIRGIESQGMVCSAFELGLATEPEAAPEILVLPKGTMPGRELADVLEGERSSNLGSVLEVSLPPNRPDLYSHVGVARELAACLGLKTTAQFRKLNLVPKLPKAGVSAKTAGAFSVKIENTEACRAYTATKMKVHVKPSPQAIKDKLAAIGLRSINNVVDITNLVMYEVGQPLHAFDAAHVHGGIVVRSARAGEDITTIDHRLRKLEPSMLVIADSDRALAVAGIMGGNASEVSDSTAEIILEAANFDAVSIRKTSRALGLRTDGSGFWEKGLKPEQAVIGAALAVEYLKKYAAAEILAVSVNGKLATPQRSVAFTTEQINSLLGSSYSKSHAKKILGAFGFTVSGSGRMKAVLPYYRQDVVNYADLAEDMLKVTGMNEMPKEPLLVQRHAVAVNLDAELLRVKTYLANLGFAEVQNYSFISEAEILKTGGDPKDFVKIKNPLSVDQGYLKHDLMVPLLKNVALNQKNFTTFKLFEVGMGYFGYGRERDFAAFILVDKHAQPEFLLSHAKGAVENLASRYAPVKKVSYHPVAGTHDLTVIVGDLPIGTIKSTQSLPLHEFGIKYPAVYVQVELKALGAVSQQLVYTSVGRFPTIELDTSIVLNENTPWKQVRDAIDRNSNGLVTEVSVFEAPYLYAPGKLPEFHAKLAAKGKKNIAFRCVFASPTKTLTDSEISPIYAKILAGIKTIPGAEIR